MSWLPPEHPKSQISKSAAALRRELEELHPQQEEEEEMNIDHLTEQDIQKILEAPISSTTTTKVI